MFIDRHSSELTNNEIIEFKKVNIIIGKNDSGKSFFMRSILMENIGRRTHFVFKDKADLQYIGENKKYFFNFKNMIENLIEDNEELNLIYNKLFIHDLCETDGHVYFTIEQEKNLKEFMDKLEKISEKTEKIGLLEKIKSEYIEIVKPMWAEPSYYYPTIRNTLLKINSNINEKRIEKNILEEYFKNYIPQTGMSELKIITGQSLSLDIKRYIESQNEFEKQKILKYKIKLAKILKVKNVDFEIINNKVYIIIDEKRCQFNAVGEGIQSIVILTFYIDDNQNTANRIFIEEPEINLHPGLQRDLVKSLAENFNSQIFLTTHSPHFVDLVYEDDKNFSIICVKKEKNKIIAYNPKIEFFETDKLLDVRASSLMLSNSIIWVEGPSDPNFINPILRLYSLAKKKKEFSKYCHYNYAFNNSINLAKHINFEDNPLDAKMNLKKISKNSFFIFDYDGEKIHKTNKKLFDFINQNLNSENVYIMKNVRTIENIIPPRYYIMFFEQSHKPAHHELFKSYFESISLKYNSEFYRNKNMIEELDNFFKQHDVNLDKTTIKKYYNSFKVDFSIFFKEKIESELNYILFSNNIDKGLEELYSSFDLNFKDMIEEIYKFIELSNR